MKLLVTLAVVALLIVAALFLFGGGELAVAPKPTPDVPRLDFAPIVALLEKDMSSIPISLDDSGPTPANAFRVKARLQSSDATHPQYQTLSQACELIIDTDKEHSVRQGQDRQAQEASASAARTALHAQAQAGWDAYRQQTDTEVRRLFGTLKNAQP